MGAAAGTLSPDNPHHEAGRTSRSGPGRHSPVTAVVVAHDGSRWLPELLAALRVQTRPPDHVVAADTGSWDSSNTALVAELGADRVLDLPRDAGFGAAASAALRRQPAAHSARTAEAGGRAGAEWVWLLHDDCIPANDALEQLLAAADAKPHAAVLGPKLRDWLNPGVLLEAGASIRGSGRRETGVEPGEFDQGQHDGVHEVLAVSTAAMLVRRDVWDELNGLAPELPLFRDDVDFGWRANAAGYRVLAATDAVTYHAEAAARGHRPTSARSHLVAAGGLGRAQREAALFTLFANLPRKQLARAMVANLALTLARVLLFLLVKRPRSAWGEVQAYSSVLGRRSRLRQARHLRDRSARRPHRSLRALMPPGWQAFRRLPELVAEVGSPGGSADGRRRRGPEPDREAGSEQEGDSHGPHGGLTARVLRRPGMLLVLALTLIALVAERDLFGGGRLGGGALLPVTGGAGDLWSQYLAGWHTSGLGNDASAQPYIAVMAALATVLLGKTWLAVDVVLLGSVPLAGASAYLASGLVVTDRRVRVWAAACYALLPVATGAVAAGRLGTAAVFMLLPLIGVLAARMLELGRREATRAAWGTGGLLAVATAFVPLAWLFALALALVAYRVWGRTQPGLRNRLAIALLVPPAVLMPWTLRLATHPGLFIREAGMLAPGALDAPGPLGVLLLQPGGPGMPPVWITIGLIVPALAALVRRDRRTAVLAGWALALLGIGAGILVSRVAASPPGEGAAAPGWPGICMALAGAGVTVAAALAAERVVAAAPSHSGVVAHDPAATRLQSSRAVRTGAAVAFVAVAVSTPVSAAAAWTYTGAGGPLDRTNPPVLPAFVAAQSEGAWHPRALVLRPGEEGSVSYAVMRERSPVLGSSGTPTQPGLTDRFAGLASGLVSDRRSNEVTALTRYGIQFAVMAGDLDPELVRNLDANPRLERSSRLPDLAVWRLEKSAPRLRMLYPGGRVQPLPSGQLGAAVQLPPGPRGRTVMLAENSDSGWQATLDGEPLPSREVYGWAQGFDVPPSGGRLEITYSSPRGLWVLVQAFLVLGVLVLALPEVGRADADADANADADADADASRAAATEPAPRRGSEREPRRSRQGRRRRGSRRRRG